MRSGLPRTIVVQVSDEMYDMLAQESEFTKGTLASVVRAACRDYLSGGDAETLERLWAAERRPLERIEVE